MNIERFKDRVRQSRVYRWKEAASYTDGLKVSRLKDTNIYAFKREDTCNSCNHTETQYLKVTYNSDKDLTIFEAGLIVALFLDEEKPKDYAKYHECEAGKEFIRALEVER